MTQSLWTSLTAEADQRETRNQGLGAAVQLNT